MTSPEDKEPFLRRWSRLKHEGGEQPPPEEAAAKPDPLPPELPPVETLTPASDFRAFLHPKVDENLRRAALKKLFSDPHFNAMDGLDVYIDDYSKSEPIPAAILAQLKQAQKIFEWAKDEAGDAESAGQGALAGDAQERISPPDAPSSGALPEAPATVDAPSHDLAQAAPQKPAA